MALCLLTEINPLSFNEFENIISRKADLFALFLHRACNFANLGFRKVVDDTLCCHFFWCFERAKTYDAFPMGSRKRNFKN